MKKHLLFLATFSVSVGLQAQKISAYAITGSQKGASNWSEVRLVDLSSGAEVEAVFQSKNQVELFSAKNGKSLAKKNAEAEPALNNNYTVQIIRKDADGNVLSHRIHNSRPTEDLNKPFATLSAACAYDKKNDRLYYTPMGIPQLRYIDLKNPSKIYYADDVPFGVVKGRADVANQITRMVFASDGNGYALTNDAKHLIKFTTKKKSTFTDLGALTDDAVNGRNSVHSAAGYGGDLIADANGNLFLITANASVFKISLDEKVASFVGKIQGLPKGFTTNGAIVEDDDKVIVCSSNSTQGYFRFSMKSLVAEKLETSGPVYNASDLANGNLLFDKKKEEQQQLTEKPAGQKNITAETAFENRIFVYPNPVTTGVVKLSFDNQSKGKYHVQLHEISGKLLSTQQFNIASKTQVEDFRMPQLLAGGNYVLRIMNDENKLVSVNKLVVQ